MRTCFTISLSCNWNRFEEEEDAIKMANDTPYGLASELVWWNL